MRCAIGKPGEPVRAYFVGSVEVIVAQMRPDEWAIETDHRGPAAISEDGSAIVPEQQP